MASSRSKRRRDEECNLLKSEGTKAAINSTAEAATLNSSAVEISFKAELKAAGILATCRTALIESPAASHVALARHRASINDALADALEVVGCQNLCVSVTA